MKGRHAFNRAACSLFLTVLSQTLVPVAFLSKRPNFRLERNLLRRDKVVRKQSSRGVVLRGLPDLGRSATFPVYWNLFSSRLIHGGESRDTTTTTMTDIWKKSLTSGKKIFNNSVNTWPIGIWFEAEKAEGLQGFAWCVRFFKQHLIKKLLTSKQIFYPG